MKTIPRLSVIGFFTELKIPFPQLQAPLVASFELGCGFMILVGLYARFAALPLIGTMVIAIFTVKMGNFKEFSDLFELEEYLFIILLMWIAVAGPGSMALDSWIGKKTARKRK